MLQGKLDLANKQIDKYTFDDATQYIKEQDKLIKALHTEIQGNKLTILQLKNTISMYDTDVRSMTISRLLDELWGRLRYRNLRYFDWKFDRLMKGIIKFRKNQRDFRRTGKTEEIAITEENCSYGYIIEWDFELVFIDINGNKYELLMMPHNIRDIIEMPVKAQIQEGRALILGTYDYSGEQVADSINVKGRSSEKAPSFRNEMQPFYRSFTVLIVGSNGKCNHYKNELQSLGLEVITYDSFEESPQRLKDQYPKADIVIICTSHIRHFVTGIIDVHASSITQIEKDSVVTIYARTRFMGVQLGLL